MNPGGGQPQHISQEKGELVGIYKFLIMPQILRPYHKLKYTKYLPQMLKLLCGHRSIERERETYCTSCPVDRFKLISLKYDSGGMLKEHVTALYKKLSFSKVRGIQFHGQIIP